MSRTVHRRRRPWPSVVGEVGEGTAGEKEEHVRSILDGDLTHAERVGLDAAGAVGIAIVSNLAPARMNRARVAIVGVVSTEDSFGTASGAGAGGGVDTGAALAEEGSPVEGAAGLAVGARPPGGVVPPVVREFFQGGTS